MRRVLNRLLAGLVTVPLAIGLVAAPVAAADDNNIVDVAVAYETANPGTFSTLITAIGCDPTAGFVAALESPGPFTVFAPTNSAFAKLGLTPANVCTALPLAKLNNILGYHVVAGQNLASGDIYTRPGFERPLKMLNGKYTFPSLFGTPRVNFAKVIIPDVDASNGVIHVIDSVLRPY